MGGFNVHCNMVYFCSNTNLYKILATYSIPVTVHVCVCIANMSVKVVDFLNVFRIGSGESFLLYLAGEVMKCKIC